LTPRRSRSDSGRSHVPPGAVLSGPAAGRSSAMGQEGGARWRRRRWALIVGTILLVLGGGVVPSRAQAATRSSVTMFSDPGDWIGGGTSRLFDSGNASIQMSGTPAFIGIDVSGGTSGDYYTFEFAAPAGQQLAPGVYVHAQR